ncbi:hypothetical protein Tco_0761000 [Tanacetum coccineum]
MSMTIQSCVKDKILAAQGEASKVKNMLAKMLHGLDQQIEKKEDGGLYFMGRIRVPIVGDMKKMIMDEAMRRVARHGVPVSIISDHDGRFTSSRLIGPELVQETTNRVVLIKERLKVAKDRQKSHANNRRNPLEFEVSDQVLLKVSPWMAFWKERKVSTEIKDREVKNLKRSRIPIVKVCWNSKRGPEFTWE